MPSMSTFSHREECTNGASGLYGHLAVSCPCNQPNHRVRFRSRVSNVSPAPGVSLKSTSSDKEKKNMARNRQDRTLRRVIDTKAKLNLLEPSSQETMQSGK